MRCPECSSDMKPVHDALANVGYWCGWCEQKWIIIEERFA